MGQIDKDTISIEWEVKDVILIGPNHTKNQAKAGLVWLLDNAEMEDLSNERLYNLVNFLKIGWQVDFTVVLRK